VSSHQGKVPVAFLYSLYSLTQPKSTFRSNKRVRENQQAQVTASDPTSRKSGEMDATENDRRRPVDDVIDLRVLDSLRESKPFVM